MNIPESVVVAHVQAVYRKDKSKDSAHQHCYNYLAKLLNKRLISADTFDRFRALNDDMRR